MISEGGVDVYFESWYAFLLYRNSANKVFARDLFLFWKVQEMIYTVTLNPSLDYMIAVNDFSLGKTNRNQQENIYVGGKGINVSQVVSTFGKETCALGFIAGFTGEEIVHQLHAKQIQTDFVCVPGFSRINVKMRTDVETEINGKGPEVSERYVEELLSKLSRLNSGDFLVLSGSVPSSLDTRIYCRLMQEVENKGVYTVVDCEGALLLATLTLHPFLIKPNETEIENVLHMKIQTYEDAIDGAMTLQKKGAKNVIVTLGENGAVFVSENGSVYVQKPVEGEVISTVGAGDSVIGGFLSMYDHGEKEAFLYGCAAGSATCFVDGLCNIENIEKMMEKIEVVQWK